MNNKYHIVHICPRKDWILAQETGDYRPSSLATEGFIHCSRPEQVLMVVNHFYQDVPDLVLLWIDPQQVVAEIRWEAADDEHFPHIYGPLEINAVVATTDLVPDPDGVYRAQPRLLM